MAANPAPGSNGYTVNQIGPNKYGAPPNNGNRQPLSGQDNGFITQDFTGRLPGATSANPNNGATSDLTSPLTLSASAGNASLIQIPPNATNMTITSATAFNISEYGTAGSALTQYYTQPANTPLTISVGRQAQIYISGGTSQVVFFFFSYL